MFFRVDDAGSRNVIAYMTWECSVKYSMKFSYIFQFDLILGLSYKGFIVMWFQFSVLLGQPSFEHL